MYNLAREISYLPSQIVNSTLFPILLMSLATDKNSPSNTKTVLNITSSYDFIVVGAGSAGATVAARLSELPCVSVLLLEAGDAPPVVNDIPAYGRSFWFTDLDWAYKTVRQSHTGRLLNNKQVLWPTGKGLGGSSLLNVMLYVRGNKKNYDDWAAQGATGWNYDAVLPYFKKLEDVRARKLLLNGYHATSGPITIEKPKYRPKIKKAIFEAAREIGYNILDSNGPKQTGFYDTEASIRNGQRCSTAKGYLVPAENRTNLHILPNAFVQKILIEDMTAVGVSIKVNNETYNFTAKKEVIVSAGSTKTPQLLMLSGIGPKEELEKFKIPVIANLPVGLNLQDHCSMWSYFQVNPDVEESNPEENIKKYLNNRSGKLASPSTVTALAFLNGSDIRPSIDFPNYELYLHESSTDTPKNYFNIKKHAYDKIYAPYENKTLYTCLSQILQPRSRGYVKLQSSNPDDSPLINPNYLEHPQDVKDIVDGIKTCHVISTTRTMQQIGTKNLQTIFPGCEQHLCNMDNYFECQARSIVTSMSHEVGTAKMGASEDPSTVVDPQLKVKGIKRLRVVDASVMPIIPSGNTNIPTIMVAEKASDIIKSTIRC